MKLNLGSGIHAIKGWMNLDAEAHPDVTVHDLRQPLPFPASSCSHVFSEHFIEHIDRDEALRLLKECWRVLTVGGVLRLSTPNLAHIADLYLRGKIDDWKGCWEPSSPAKFFNEAMREWGHKFLYDELEMIEILQEAGFDTIVRCKWKESEHEALRGLEVRPFNNEIIFEATKGYARSGAPSCRVS